MPELNQFCAELGVDVDDARQALMGEGGDETSALAMPWYVRLVVGVGAWVTAMAAIGLGAAIVFVALDVEFDGGIAVLGAAYLIVGLILLRQDESGVYLTQLGIAVTAAGVAMIALGVGLQSDELWTATLATVVVTAVLIFAAPSRTLQFLAALLAAWLFGITLLEQKVPYYLDIVALAGPAGVVLMLKPLQRDLQPTALVLLLLFPLFAIFGPSEFSWVYGSVPDAGGWFAKGLHIGLFLWLVSIHWARAATRDVRERLGPFAVAAVIVCVLLPPGGSAALVIMMLAFVLGSRPLALLGTLLQIYYLWRFYYDMDVTLLVKSGMLSAVGAVLLFVWWLMMRRAPEGVRL
jgi:uncharacterized membrane protein